MQNNIDISLWYSKDEYAAAEKALKEVEHGLGIVAKALKLRPVKRENNQYPNGDVQVTFRTGA